MAPAACAWALVHMFGKATVAPAPASTARRVKRGLVVIAFHSLEGPLSGAALRIKLATAGGSGNSSRPQLPRWAAGAGLQCALDCHVLVDAASLAIRSASTCRRSLPVAVNGSSSTMCSSSGSL